MFSVFQKIAYFRNLTPKTFHLLIYSFHEFEFEAGFELLKEGDPISFLIIVMSGELEMVMHVDGIEFVVAKLTKGAVAYPKNILFNEESKFIELRCSKNGVFKVLTKPQFENLSRTSEIKFKRKKYK